MAAHLFAPILRDILVIVVISTVLGFPQQKQITQQKQQTTQADTVTRVQDPKCLQPKETGPCRMNLDRFYYNAETNACEPFKFGGCRGNDNKFGFLKTCEDACVIKTAPTNNVSNSKPKTPVTGPVNTVSDSKSKTPVTGPVNTVSDSESKAPAAGTVIPKAPATASQSSATKPITKAPISTQIQSKDTKPIK